MSGKTTYRFMIFANLSTVRPLRFWDSDWNQNHMISTATSQSQWGRYNSSRCFRVFSSQFICGWKIPQIWNMFPLNKLPFSSGFSKIPPSFPEAKNMVPPMGLVWRPRRSRKLREETCSWHGPKQLVPDAGKMGWRVPSGKHTRSYWKWPFIVDFPIKNGDFP